VQNYVEERAVNLQTTVVVNAQFPDRFMKKLTRERVAPVISASISWPIFGTTASSVPSLPEWASCKRSGPASFRSDQKVIHRFARLGFGGPLSLCLENRWVVEQETWAAPLRLKQKP